MECSSLDQIFNQIIESERMVEKERMILLQVRADIKQCEQLVKTKKDTNLSLVKQKSALCQQLVEEKVKSDYLHNKECILTQKKMILQQRREAYFNEKEIMREQLHSNRIAFCNEVETFMTTIGLQLLQPDHSAYNMEMQMINLKQKEKQLTKVINEFNKCQVDASEYQHKKQQIYLKFKEQQQQLEEFHDIIEQSIQQLQLAKEENEKVTLMPSTDPEFIRQRLHLLLKLLGMVDLLIKFHLTNSIRPLSFNLQNHLKKGLFDFLKGEKKNAYGYETSASNFQQKFQISNEQLQEQLEYTLLKPDCHSCIRQQINLCQQNNAETEQQCAEKQVELKQLQKWKKQPESQTNYGHIE